MRFILYKNHDHEFTISLRYVRLIREQWSKGKTWQECSPLYDLTREQIAEIVSLKEHEILARCK